MKEAHGPPFFCPARAKRPLATSPPGRGHCDATSPGPSMPRLPAVFRRGIVLLVCLVLLPACQPAEEGAGRPSAWPSRSGSKPPPARSMPPTCCATALLAHDGAGFARLAVPADLHARLAAGWKDGRSRWPLDELPLDGRIPKMLATLQAPGADKALMTTFRQQFAGADRDIDQAIRTLVLFGGEYVQNDGDYTARSASTSARRSARSAPGACRHRSPTSRARNASSPR